MIKILDLRIINFTVHHKKDTKVESTQASYDHQSVDSVLSAAQIIYNEEIGRFNQIENKTNISMAFSGALLGILLTVYNLKIFNDHNYMLIIYMFYSIKILNLLLICKALYYFSKSIKSKEFNQFPLSYFFQDHSYFKKDSTFVKIEIAASFNRTIQENIELISEKIKYYDDGNNLIFVSLIIFILIWSLEQIVNVIL